MESQSPGPPLPGAARDQLRAARQAHDVSMRRATGPVWIILVISVFCGMQTVSPAYRGPGSVVMLVAVALLMVALVSVAARNGWVAMRFWSQPKWNAGELSLIAAAVLVGGGVGPHVLADDRASALVSWGFGAVVVVFVAACLYGAVFSYRRRLSRLWRR